MRLFNSTSGEGFLHDAPTGLAEFGGVLRRLLGFFGQVEIDRFYNSLCGVHDAKNRASVVKAQLEKAVSCSCGECLIDMGGKVIRQTVVKTDGDSLFAFCTKCKGHTRLGKFEMIDAPQKEERAKKSRLKIVYIPNR